MNRAQVATLLGGASAVDPRIPAPDPDVLAMWAAILDDVPAEVAADAVREHYRHRSETVMPADIVAHWRTVRRDAAEQRHRAELTARARRLDDNGLRAIRDGITRVTAALAVTRGVDPEHAEAEADVRRAWLAVTCPYCRARPGTRCTGPGGRPLTRTAAHPARLDAAFAAMTNQGETA
ncbi:zinc finger domain-containing protein [Actinokineospora sp. G85]|uniref:zinc finger domain-containing protein n=1 Tax=Actinokineospora sp. G85 TaxID=3406626 RepID=UPI003C795BBF